MNDKRYLAGNNPIHHRRFSNLPLVIRGRRSEGDGTRKELTDGFSGKRNLDRSS
jgi:hypothetical protein